MTEDTVVRMRRARSAWRAAWRRCTEPAHRDWRHYGGRGIRVTGRWATFDAFLKDMGLPPSDKHWLGRRDTAAGYHPGNAEWTTRRVQVGRRAYCHLVPLNGQLPTLAEAARIVGVHDMTFRRRLLEQARPLREAVCTTKLRRRDSMLLTHAGLTLPLPAWARMAGLRPQVLWHRVKREWPIDEALRTPVGVRRSTSSHERRPVHPTTQKEQL